MFEAKSIDCDFTITEVIKHVIQKEDPPFRPKVDRALCPPGLYSLMENCWSESPTKRPNFKEIRSEMKNITK